MRVKLHLLLIDNALNYRDSQDEIREREKLWVLLKKGRKFKKIHFANQYRLGVLSHRQGQPHSSIGYFTQLLESLPTKEVKTRNLVLQHLAKIGQQEKDYHLWEKYLSAFVKAQGKSAEFYQTSGGFEALIKLANISKSGRENTYFKGWAKAAKENGSSEELKGVLIEWVNYVVEHKPLFVEEPFEGLIGLYGEEEDHTALRKLRLLYAQTVPGEKKRMAIYEAILQADLKQNKLTNIGILSRLLKYYQNTKNKQGEQRILHSLSNREDYPDQEKALSQFAAISLKNKDWPSSLKAHQKLLSKLPLDKNRLGIIVLNNLINIAGKLSYDELRLEYLIKKALTPSAYITDKERLSAYLSAMEVYKEQKTLKAAIGFYQKMMNAPFQKRPFLKIDQVHFVGARLYETVRDYPKAISAYQLTLDHLLSKPSEKGDKALKIARQIHKLMETHFPDQEIEALTKIRGIQKKYKLTSEQAKTELILAQKFEGLGKAKQAIEQYKVALATYKKIGNAKMESQILTLLANLDTGSLEEKLQHFQELDVAQKNSGQFTALVSTRIELGHLYKKLKDVKKALTAYISAVDLDKNPNNVQAIQAAFYAAGLLQKEGDLEQAIKTLTSVVKRNPTTTEGRALILQVYLKRAKIEFHFKQQSTALNTLDEGLQRATSQLESGELYLTKSSILINIGKFQEAIESLGKLDPKSPHYKSMKRVNLKAQALLGLQQPELAIEELEQLVNARQGSNLNEDRIQFFRLKRRAYRLIQKHPKAIETQKELLELMEIANRTDVLGIERVELAELQLEAGKLADAFQSCEQAQLELAPKSKEFPRLYLSFAKTAYRQNRLEKAMGYFDKFEGIVTQETSVSLVAEMLYYRGFTLLESNRYDNALVEFRQAKDQYAALGNKQKAILSEIAAANVLMKLGQMTEAEHLFQSMIEKGKVYKEALGEINGSLSLLYSNLGAYAKALTHSKKSEKIYHDLGLLRRVPEVLNARGLIFLKINDFDRAELVLSKALELNASIGNSLLESEIMNNLAGLFRGKGELKEAAKLMLKTADLQRKLGFESKLALTYNNIGSINMELKRTEDALHYFKQSRSFALRLGLKQEEAISWNNEGILFFQQEKLKSAKRAFQEAAKLQKAMGLKLDYARTLNNLSIIAAKKEDYKNALMLVQEAIANLSFKKISSTDFSENPEESYILAPDVMKGFLQNKGGYLKELADKEPTSNKKGSLLKTAATSFTLSISLIESLRSMIQGEESQQMLVESNIDIYSQLISVLFELGNIDPEGEHHQTAFLFSERSRAQNLLEQLQEQAARESLELPAEIRKEEADLKGQVASIDKNIYEELKKPKKDRSEEKIKGWQSKKRKILIKYKAFSLEISKKFPTFASLKYPKIYGVKEVQKDLVSTTSQIIGYAMGKEASFGWAIGKTAFSMKKLPGSTGITKLVKKYRKTIKDPLVYPDEEDEELIVDSTQIHLATGLQLYRTILKPLVDEKKKITKLTIIPDGVLYYLPFETVVIGLHPQITGTFTKGREYLNNRYAVNYAPSASVLGAIRQQFKAKDPKQLANRRAFVGFGDPEYAPSAKEESRFKYNMTLKNQGFYELDRLFSSIGELKQIANIFHTSKRIFLREETKESIVKQNLNGYRYVHFATHGIVDEINPEFSGVVMNLIQKDPNEDGFLQASEIFNLKMNADLVTLSACETGLGKVIKGEGMVGLTRSFLYAGTKSVVVSLWTVADESTAKLMINFYRYLSKGVPKDEALRRARIDLMSLKDGEDYLYHDPFYWGPFVLNGLDS